MTIIEADNRRSQANPQVKVKHSTTRWFSYGMPLHTLISMSNKNHRSAEGTLRDRHHEHPRQGFQVEGLDRVAVSIGIRLGPEASRHRQRLAEGRKAESRKGPGIDLR